MGNSVVGPMGMGALVGALSVAVTLILGAPIWAALVAYSACGSLGLLLGAALNYRAGSQTSRARNSRSGEVTLDLA